MTPLCARWLGWTAALCLLGACASSGRPAAPQPATPPTNPLTGEVIDLHFAWPVGLTARVQYEERGEAQTPQGAQSIVFRSSHRMRVEQADEGLRVIHDEFSVEPVTSAEGAQSPGGAPQKGALESESDAQVGNLLPDLIVDHNGKLLRIAGMDRLRADALDRMSRGTEESPESRARLERWIGQGVSDAKLRDKATRDWNAIVAFWLGARLAVGTTSAPRAGGGASDQVTVSARVPCDAADRSASCVRIELETHPAPELHETISLLTEPERLVPHEVRVSNEIHARLTRPDGKQENIDQRTGWSYHFSYSSHA